MLRRTAVVTRREAQGEGTTLIRAGLPAEFRRAIAVVHETRPNGDHAGPADSITIRVVCQQRDREGIRLLHHADGLDHRGPIHASHREHEGLPIARHRNAIVEHREHEFVIASSGLVGKPEQARRTVA